MVLGPLTARYTEPVARRPTGGRGGRTVPAEAPLAVVPDEDTVGRS
ncbi:hypothetical protein ACH47Z_04815 [Streptomyces sp. NPDC020192]